MSNYDFALWGIEFRRDDDMLLTYAAFSASCRSRESGGVVQVRPYDQDDDGGHDGPSE